MSTPWTRTSSSLPSDRIKPRNTQPQTLSKSSGKQKQKQEPEPPKSKPLLTLESLLRALQSTTTTPAQDPKGGCFCQAREHPLSPYTPACPTCGLVLCTLNLPQHACPHCRTPPPPRNRETLIGRLQGEIADLTRREEEARERAREEARVAAGAFPSLSGGGGVGRSTPPPPPPTQQQHKVLSLNRKTKKVTVSSYTSTPASSRPASPAPEEEPLRVPPPPGEVVYAKRNVDRGRPYANFGGGAARYEENKGGQKGKGRGKENEAGPS